MTDAHGAIERERRRFKVGVTIHPQQCTINELRDAWRRADALGVDSIWFWDHFFPLYGDPEGNQFECWSLLAAAAVDTQAPQIGPMVSAIGYRNPDLIAYMAGTIDQLSGGRFVPRIKERIAKLKPGPAGPMPILIGGGGEKVTLRLVAEHAQMWNALGDPDEYARKSEILNGYCRDIGRDPREIERTANVSVRTEKDVEKWLEAGLQHFVLRLAKPFDTRLLERILKAARA